MKKEFPGYFSSAEVNKKIWGECFFIFDANILLNLYRYSDATRQSFIETLESLKNRAWIPHQVASEFLNNRVKVILDQSSEYKNTIDAIRKLKDKLENAAAHPFIKDKTLEAVSTRLNEAIKELETNKQKYEERITEDEIRESLASIFDNRVGKCLEKEDLNKIILEGEERYKEKTPPGYSDIKKQSQDDSFKEKIRPYGDLIIWKSILSKAEEDKMPVIFVTGDHKEDWWLKGGGKTLGPRPELIKEFRDRTDKDFYMYLPEQFLKFAKENMHDIASKEILEEIKSTRAYDSLKSYAENFTEEAHALNRLLEFHKNNEPNKGLSQATITSKLNKLRYEMAILGEIEDDLRDKVSSLNMNLAFQSNMLRGPSDREGNETMIKIRTEIRKLETKIKDNLIQSEKLLAHIERLESLLSND